MIDIFDYYFQWSLVLGLIFTLWCYKWVLPRFHTAGAALLWFTGLSVIWVWIWKENRYVTVDPYNQTALRYFAADSLLKLLIVLVPLMLAVRKDAIKYSKYLAQASRVYIVVNGIWVIASYAWTQGCHVVNTCGGLNGNPSIGASLVVCMLPLAHGFKKHERYWWALGLAILAVVISKSSIAIGLLALYIAIQAWRYDPKLMLSASIPVGIGILMLGKHEFLNDSDRFKMWSVMMHAWYMPWNIAMGTGIGTYHVFSVNIQEYFKASPSYHWLWLHNDWLQQVFEGGVVGFILMLSAYTAALVKTIREREIDVAVSIILFGAYMLLNPAIHPPYPALFAAALFTYALNKNTLLNGSLTA